MSHLRLSPRQLGQLLLKDFCPRCFWYMVKLHFRLPWECHMPGLMYQMDSFEKRVVRAHLEEHGELPKWLKPLNCSGCAEFPPKMTMDFPKFDVTLVGKPDEVFKKKNGHLYLVDYKTALGNPDDPFLPAYEIQLQGYVKLLESNKVGTVDSMGIVYFANALKDPDVDDLQLLTSDGFNVPFLVKIHEVDIDRHALDPLLEQVREFADRRMPPEGLEGCENCGRLQKLLDDEVNRRGAEDYRRNRDSLARLLSRGWEADRQKARAGLVAEDGHLIVDLATEEFDAVPASWDF